MAKYKEQINYASWKASKNPEEFLENKQEALLAYVEITQNIQKTGGKSYVGKCIKNHLSNKNRKKRKEVFFEDLPKPDGNNSREEFYTPWEMKTPETYLLFKESLNSLSENAQEVVRIILFAPKETWDIIDEFNRKSDRANLIEYIRWEYEWGYCKIWKIFNEIRETIFSDSNHEEEKIPAEKILAFWLESLKKAGLRGEKNEMETEFQ